MKLICFIPLWIWIIELTPARRCCFPLPLIWFVDHITIIYEIKVNMHAYNVCFVAKNKIKKLKCFRVKSDDPCESKCGFEETLKYLLIYFKKLIWNSCKQVTSSIGNIASLSWEIIHNEAFATFCQQFIARVWKRVVLH